MTFSAVLLAIRRRWYVLLAALLVAVIGFAAFLHDGGIYTTKTIVSFLIPATTTLSPDNGSDDDSVIAFARSVAAQANVGRDPVSYSEDDAPYYGAGLRQSVLVDVPSDGNQWYESFNHAEIDIQIVGRTAAWVKKQQRAKVDQILAITDAQQRLVDANPKQYITASVVPLTENITAVSSSRGTQAVALGALVLAALLVGGWGAVAVDRRVARTRTTRRPAEGRRAPLNLKGSMT